MERYMGLVGLAFLLVIAYVFSSSKSTIRWRTVVWGLSLQFIFALLILKTPMGRDVFAWCNDFIVGFLNSAQAGASFVFGDLTGMNAPVLERQANGEFVESTQFITKTGAIFAFTVLPTIIFFASFMAVMYHLGVMEKLINGVGRFMQRTLGTSGPESMSAAANIFVGQTEAPLVVKPYIEKMSRSELMAIMTCGFATVAGSVMVAFVGFLSTGIPTIAGHLLAASIMSAPAALVMAKLFVPEDPDGHNAGPALRLDKVDSNVIDAAVRGASEGMKLCLNVVAMVIAFLALMALANTFLGWLGGHIGMSQLSLPFIFGKIFAPVSYLLGVEWSEAGQMGHLIGTKLMANEFVAYLELKKFIDGGMVSERTALIASYALCGFANVSSIGIQIGALSALAPNRRQDLAKLGFRAMFAGAFASFSTACIAGLLL